MPIIDLTQLQAVLQEYALDVGEQYKANLRGSERIASANLINSVETKVEVNGNVFSVTMDVASYWKYVENDTRPHWPPPSAILQWIRVKPVIPRPDSNGKVPTEKQLAFLIGRKIAADGTKGSHDLRDAKETVMTQYRDRISEALGRDLEYYIAKVVAPNYSD